MNEPGASSNGINTQPEPTSIEVHGVTWVKEEILSPIQGPLQRIQWSFLMQDGISVHESGGVGSRTFHEFFLYVVPMHHLDRIVQWTSALLAHGKVTDNSSRSA